MAFSYRSVTRNGVKIIPRDASGNFSLPAGTIVNSGDVILPSQHNPAMNDIAASMTNSLARTGAGGMLADLNLGGFSLANGLNGSFGGTLNVGLGASFNATVFVGDGGGDGFIALAPGNTTNSGTLALYDSGGTLRGTISRPQTGANTGKMVLAVDGGGFVFDGGPVTVNAILNAAGLQVGGTSVVLTGSSPTFSSISVTGNLSVSGSASIAGGLTANSDIVVTSGGSSAAIKAGGDIRVSRAGGATGAVYFNFAETKYLFNDGTRYQLVGGDLRIDPGRSLDLNGAAVRFASSKIIFSVGGTDVASLDGSGNFRCLGNMTGNAGSL